MGELRDRIYDRYVDACGLTDTRGESLYARHIVARHFPANRHVRILDLGCGAGDMLVAAKRAGYTSAWGVDRSPQQIARARGRGVDARLADLLETLGQQPAASVDVVLMLDVLEHLRSTELVAAVDAVVRALRPGGRWIIHAPNGESPFVGRVRYGDITHEQAFTRGSLAQLLGTHGFDPIEFHEDAPLVHGAKSAIRWLAWKGIRGMLRVYLAAETGSTDPRAIFSQNLLAVAHRQ